MRDDDSKRREGSSEPAVEGGAAAGNGSELLERLRQVARRGKKTVEEMAQRILERAVGRSEYDRSVSPAELGAVPEAVDPAAPPTAPGLSLGAVGGPGRAAPVRPAPPSSGPQAGEPPSGPVDREAQARAAVSAARFARPVVGPEARSPLPDDLLDVDQDLPALPESYGERRVVLLSRDPSWLYCYWDLPESDREVPRSVGARLTLRLLDVTDLAFDGHNAWAMHLYPVSEESHAWYLPVPAAGRGYLAQIGYTFPNGAFEPLASSVPTSAPPAGPSPYVHDVFTSQAIDQPLPPPAPAAELQPGFAREPAGPLVAWHGGEQGHPVTLDGPRPVDTVAPAAALGPGGATLGEALAAVSPTGDRSGPLSFGRPGGPSSAEALLAGLPGAPGQGGVLGIPGSPGGPWSAAVTSWGGPVGGPVPGAGRDFFLWVEAELIVWGGTRPDARLTLGGRELPLAPDGTFWLRMPFPDGEQHAPVRADAPDGQWRAVSLHFQRRTERPE